MFAYCGNNPVNYVDYSGEYLGFIKKLDPYNMSLYGSSGGGFGGYGSYSTSGGYSASGGGFISNIPSAFLESLEIQIGFGMGFGANISNTITAEASRDTYIGIDDGQLITGNIITAELSAFDNFKIGDSFNHLVEKGGNRVTTSGSAYDGPFDMIFYDDVKHGPQLSYGLWVIDSDGDVLISWSASAHFIIGGHISFSINLSEFLERICG